MYIMPFINFASILLVHVAYIQKVTACVALVSETWWPQCHAFITINTSNDVLKHCKLSYMIILTKSTGKSFL